MTESICSNARKSLHKDNYLLDLSKVKNEAQTSRNVIFELSKLNSVRESSL